MRRCVRLASLAGPLLLTSGCGCDDDPCGPAFELVISEYADGRLSEGTWSITILADKVPIEIECKVTDIPATSGCGEQLDDTWTSSAYLGGSPDAVGPLRVTISGTELAAHDESTFGPGVVDVEVSFAGSSRGTWSFEPDYERTGEGRDACGYCDAAHEELVIGGL